MIVHSIAMYLHEKLLILQFHIPRPKLQGCSLWELREEALKFSAIVSYSQQASVHVTSNSVHIFMLSSHKTTSESLCIYTFHHLKQKWFSES